MTDKGLKPDWKKVEAILRLLSPIYAEAVRRLQDMVICLAKVVRSAIGNGVKNKRPRKLKIFVTTAPLLAYYDVSSQRVGRLIGKQS